MNIWNKGLGHFRISICDKALTGPDLGRARGDQQRFGLSRKANIQEALARVFIEKDNALDVSAHGEGVGGIRMRCLLGLVEYGVSKRQLFHFLRLVLLFCRFCIGTIKPIESGLEIADLV